MKRILIIGATSSIAIACAQEWAKQGAELYLVGRNESKLASIQADLDIRGASRTRAYTLDITDHNKHNEMLQSYLEHFGQIDIALIATGTLPDQNVCEQNVEQMIKEVNINGIAVMALMTLLASQFEKQRCGSLAVISSVAGDRGRPSNYVYGSAKAALSTFCEGLRARMYKLGVSVTDIKPGFVDTAMTKGLDLPTLLVSQPEKVAKLIVKGINRKSNVLYVPGYWGLIMLIIKLIPQYIFKKLSL